MSEPTVSTTTPPAHHSFLQELEAVCARWLPFLVTGAEVGAAISGNPELDPIIASAGGAAEAAVRAAQSVQDGDLQAAVTQVGTAIVQAKQAAGISTAPPTPPAP